MLTLTVYSSSIALCPVALNKIEKVNNFQREETVRWLLNISQAVIVGGAGSLFIPEVFEKVGAQGAAASFVLGSTLYLLAMHIGRRVKNVK